MPRKQKRPLRTLASTLPLTDDNPMRAHTYPGQASWAINSKHTCRECVQFESPGRFAGGVLKPGRCKLAAQYLPYPQPRFPHHAKACKEFKRNADAPAMFKEPIAGKR